MKTWKVVGVSFDHMHMGDLLREVSQHPRAEIVGIADDNPENAEKVRMTSEMLGIPPARSFNDFAECMDKTQPDLVILCPATARHADFVEFQSDTSYRDKILDLNDIAYSFRDAHKPGARYNGGDSFEEVNARVVGALERLIAEPEWDTLALVAHGGINRLVIGWAFGTGLQTFAAIDQNTCCLNVIDFDEHPETREIVRKSVRAMNIAVYDVVKEGNHLQSLEQIAMRLREAGIFD